MVDSTLMRSGRQGVGGRGAELPPTFASFEEFAQPGRWARPPRSVATVGQLALERPSIGRMIAGPGNTI
jgi:hypothetical protein